MPEQVLLDNDVALKVACYSLVSEMVALITADGALLAMLGVGKFVIRGRLDRASNIADRSRAKRNFEQLLAAVIMLEPDEEELAIAARLEAEAARRNLELDGGESQLLAILSKRASRLLITGDKRAIAAMAVVAPDLAANRVGCMEQLMIRLLESLGIDVVRPLVCSEPLADRAVSSCFACASSTVTREGVLAGLMSYIGHLDRLAPRILASDFSAVSVAGRRA